MPEVTLAMWISGVYFVYPKIRCIWNHYRWFLIKKQPDNQRKTTEPEISSAEPLTEEVNLKLVMQSTGADFIHPACNLPAGFPVCYYGVQGASG